MNAIYVSVWDGGQEVKSSCEYDPETREVSDIQSVDVNVDVLEDEYILLPDGTEVRDFIPEGNDAESLSGDDINFLRNLFGEK